MASAGLPLVVVVMQVAIPATIIILLWVCSARRPTGIRPGAFFSVAVDSDFPFSAEGVRLTRRFRWHVAIHSLIGLALTACSFLALDGTGLFLALPMTGFFWQVIGWMVTYAVFRRRVLRMTATCAEESRGVSRAGRVPLAGRWLWAGPPLVALALGICGWLYWSDVVHGRPMGFDLSGKPVFPAPLLSPIILPLLGILSWLVLFLIAAGLSGLKRRGVSSESTDASDAWYVRGVQWFYLCFAFWLAATLGSGGLLLGRCLAGMPFASLLVLAVVSDVALIALAFDIYSHFSRDRERGVARQEPASEDEATDAGGTSNSTWKLGLYYFNPDDPAHRVKMEGKGCTTENLAHPRGVLRRARWLCLIVALVLCGDAMRYLRYCDHHDIRPWVVEAYPADGAENIAAGLAEIRLQFDQPMDLNRGAIARSGSPLPEAVGEPQWVDDRTWVLPVQLEAGREYKMMVDPSTSHGFRSRNESYPPQTVIEFHTAGPKPATAPVSE
jgi:uncharacterized membrane protein